MIWGSLKSLAGQFVHKKSFDFDSLQPILCDELTQLLIVMINEGVKQLTLAPDSDTGLNFSSVPADYGATVSVTSTGLGEFDPVPIKNLIAGQTKGDATYAISGGKLYTKSSGSLVMVYQKKIIPAASDAASNVVLDNYSNIYLYGILKHAGTQLEDDEMVAKYKPFYDEAVLLANGRYNDQAFGPGMEASIPGGPI